MSATNSERLAASKRPEAGSHGHAIRSSRSAFSAGAKASSKSGGLLFPKGKLSTTTANRLSLAFSLVGLGLTTRNASQQNWGFGNAPDAVGSIYTALGFAKYLGETYSGLAKLKVPVGGYTYSGGAGKFFFGENAGDLTNSPAFKALGFFYYGAGAFTAGAAAFDAANNGNVETTLDAAAALGNAGNAAKSFLGLFTDLSEPVLEDIGLASSGFGLLATAASLGWQLWGAANQQAVNTADNAKSWSGSRAQSRLGTGVGGAGRLIAVPHTSAEAVCGGEHTRRAFAKVQSFRELESGYLSSINQFMYQASRMPMQPNGTFPSTASGDGVSGTIDKSGIEDPTKTGQVEWVYEPLPADSLAQLKHWAQVLFGNQVG